MGANSSNNQLTREQILIQNQLIQQQLTNQIASLNQPQISQSGNNNNNSTVEALQLALNMAGQNEAAKNLENSTPSNLSTLDTTPINRKRKNSPISENETMSSLKINELVTAVHSAAAGQQSQQQQGNNQNLNLNLNQNNKSDGQRNTSSPKLPACKKGRYHCNCGTTFEQETSFNAHKKHYCELSSNSGQSVVDQQLLSLLTGNLSKVTDKEHGSEIAQAIMSLRLV